MDVTAAEADAITLEEHARALRAFIDLGPENVKGGAGVGLETENAAAVEAHAVDGDVAAVLEVQDPAGAGAGFLRMAGGKVEERDIFAVPEIQHIGIAGDCREGDGGRIRGSASDGESGEVVDHKLRPVIARRPVVIFAADAAVTGGGG